MDARYNTAPATQSATGELCACGSGISQQRCCDLKQVNLLNNQQQQAIAPHFQRARTAIEENDRDKAQQICVAILEKAPSHIASLRMLWEIHKQAEHATAAEALLKRLVKLQPNDGDLACELSLVQYRRRDMGNAEYNARNAIRLQPRNPQAHNMMGMILTDQGRTLAGEYHYRKALELHEPLGKLCANVGLNLKNQGKMDESEEFYRQAMELEPDNVASLLGWVKLEEARRNFDKAWELLQKAEELAPGNGEVMVTRAVLYSRNKEFDKALQELDKLEERSPDGNLGPGFYMEKGRVLDKLERYDEAFACYDRANRLIRESGRGTYNEKFPQVQANRLKKFYTHTRMEILPRATVRKDVAQPLFIIGFPRSGTTMTEQILTAHPNICAGDELTFIGDLVRFGPKLLNSPLDYPESFADLWMGENQEALDDFRDWYLKRTQQLGILEDVAKWFTDKMPLNETHLGMIHMVFPESPVVHLLRHPLDVILSTFFIDLTHGFNCSYSLKTAARHYLLAMDLVEHYKQELDLKYTAVRYEDLVSDQENQVRGLLGFIGEDWDDACLNFHENQRYARTASYAQVTEKLYTSSRYRYRNYKEHLGEIIPMLEPVIEKLGYEIE